MKKGCPASGHPFSLSAGGKGECLARCILATMAKGGRRRPWRRGAALLRRPLVACLLILAVYVGLSFVNDPRAQLASDSGSKVATLKVMAERDRLDPDVGYWAERWDPTGRVHPLATTARIGEKWVQVTTLPMLYAAFPLYQLGGYRLALLLPMLGGVLTALAARSLARRVGGGEGWGAFWLIGLASPLLIYSLDFWEHSLGVAAMAWAMVLLSDVVQHRRGWLAAIGAGALFGTAATMRTEALVYAAVAVAGVCLIILFRQRRRVFAVATGAAAAAGLVVPLVANWALEVATIGQSIRSERAAGTAGLAVSDAGAVAGLRLREAVGGALGLFDPLDAGFLVVGAGLVGLLAVALRRVAGHGDFRRVRVAVTAVALLYLARFAVGPGVVPGLVIASPLAIVGLALGWAHRESRYILGVAVASLPVVWATQYPGSATAAVGGRYILLSGLLFAVVGIVALTRLPVAAARYMVALAIAVTGFSLTWMSVRTHGYASASAALVERSEPVLISRFFSLGRSGGDVYGERRLLSARNEEDQRFAVSVLDRAGIDRFGLVLPPGVEAESIAGWEETGRDSLELVSGVDLTVITYDRR